MLRRWLFRDPEDEFTPRRRVYWTGRRCEHCNVPLLSVPKHELHMPGCPKGTTANFQQRVEVKS